MCRPVMLVYIYKCVCAYAQVLNRVVDTGLRHLDDGILGFEVTREKKV